MTSLFSLLDCTYTLQYCLYKRVRTTVRRLPDNETTVFSYFLIWGQNGPLISTRFCNILDFEPRCAKETPKQGFYLGFTYGQSIFLLLCVAFFNFHHLSGKNEQQQNKKIIEQPYRYPVLSCLLKSASSLRIL